MAIALPAPLEQLTERIGGPRRAAIAAVGVGTVVLILGLSRWASAPTYVPVFNDLPLEIVGKITSKLEEEGIPFQLERGGSELHVPSTELARTRVLLAGEGLPSAGRPGMELFDQPSWGMTDFAQRINYRRALEGELERTVGKMNGVASAKVHLAMDDTRSFQADTRPKEASVVLRLRSGAPAGPEVVRGIQHLVASSVDGLQSENVTVIDDTGRMLSAPSEPGSIETLTSRQLGMQREVEAYLENKSQQLIDQIVGPGSARIKVAADINFDRVERTTEKVDPDGQVVSNEQKAEIVPGAEGGAGSTTTSTSYDNSRSMESYTGATGNVRRLTVAVVVDEKKVAAGDSVAYQARTAEELAQIEMLVRNAVGINEGRGDVISVVGMRFSPPPFTDVEPATDVLTVAREYQNQIMTLVALLIAAFVALRVVRTLKGPEPEPAPMALETGEAPAAALPAPDGPTEDSLGLGDTPMDLLENLLPQRALTSANTRMRNEVVASVEDQPEVAVRLVRAWLREV